MAMQVRSDKQIRGLATPGIFKVADMPTLYVKVRYAGSSRGSWVQKVTIEGKRVERGLGGVHTIPMREAKRLAQENLVAINRGENPFARRDQARREVAIEVASTAPTFAAAVEAVIAIQRGAWKNPKSEAQWRSSLEAYAMPKLGRMAVDAIQTPDVLDVLKPIWDVKRETASRVKQRISAVMQWAIAERHRQDNPVAAVEAVLPKARNGRKHHDALPYCQVADAVATVRESNAHLGTKLAFEFLVLTAARSGEVREAVWDEVDLDEGLWTVPAERMKAKVEHVVPLPKAARRILKAAAKRYGNDGLIFPSPRGKALSDATVGKLLRENGVKAVPHGFRSSFRDWAGENGYPRDIAEAALAHTIKNAVEAAYHRTHYLEQRRKMMAKWAKFCLPKD